MIPVLAALLLTTSATARDEPGSRDAAVVAKSLNGKTPGPPRTCLSPYDAENSSVHNGTVLFRTSSKLVWKNDMEGCTVLREDDILQTNLYGTARLCRGDIAQVIDRGGHYTKGACTFGEFVPYRK
jgi:hypothetical protein